MRSGNPAKRFSFSRLIEGFPAPPTPTQPRATWQEAVAVYVVIGWEPRNGDILAPPGDWLPELLRNRYIRLWIFRHRHLAAAQLISTSGRRRRHRTRAGPRHHAAGIVGGAPCVHASHQAGGAGSPAAESSGARRVTRMGIQSAA